MSKETEIEVLNSLIGINNDRIEGYETASKETEELDLKTIFFQSIETSQKCKTELVEKVQQLDGIPLEGTKITGKFFRIWMDVKATLTGNDRKTILNSCEYLERVAMDAYDKALRNNNEDLTEQQQAMLNAQYILIQADHNQVTNLKNKLVEIK